MAVAIVNATCKGYDIVMHCHDEIILEAPNNIGYLEEVCDVMATAPTWVDGILLAGDGYICDYYKKD